MPSEFTSIRVDSAETSTTSAPTAATDGIEVHPISGLKRLNVHLLVEKTAATGPWPVRVKVHGYRSKTHTQAEGGVLTEVATTSWYEIFDSKTYDSSANHQRGFFIEGATDYLRLDTEIVENGGTTPTCTTHLSFGRMSDRSQ